MYQRPRYSAVFFCPATAARVRNGPWTRFGTRSASGRATGYPDAQSGIRPSRGNLAASAGGRVEVVIKGGCRAARVGVLGVLLLTPSAEAHRLTIKKAKQAAHVGKTATCKRLGRHRVRCTTPTRVVRVTLRGRRVKVTRRTETPVAAPRRQSPPAVHPVTASPEAPGCHVKPPAPELP
jgi:hypothetical protein